MRSFPRALLALAPILVVAGCVAPAASSLTADAPSAGAFDASWGSSVRRLSLPPGESFGLVMADFAGAEDQEGATVTGLAVNASALGEGGSIRMFALVPADGGWTLGGATAARGDDGTFGIGVGERAAFIIAAHAPQGVTLDVTGWSQRGDAFPRNFERPRAEGAWDASGPASVSYFHQSSSGSSENGMTVERVAPPASALPGVAGRFVIESEHEGALPGIVVARGVFGGLAGGSAFDVAWTHDADTEARTFPAASQPGPVRPYPGFTLLQAARGPTALQVEATGAVTMGALTIEHFSLPVDLAKLGVEVVDHFEGGPAPQETEVVRSR